LGGNLTIDIQKHSLLDTSFAEWLSGGGPAEASLEHVPSAGESLAAAIDSAKEGKPCVSRIYICKTEHI
jgi:hypothetical protein